MRALFFSYYHFASFSHTNETLSLPPKPPSLHTLTAHCFGADLANFTTAAAAATTLINNIINQVLA